ncbi:MAG: STM4014 family protein [Gemmataceae bacterium]
MDIPTPRYVAIANADGKRWQLYYQELKEYWAEQGRVPELEVVSWAEVVVSEGNLDALPAFDAPAIVRIESPGKDFDVTRRFLRAGTTELAEQGRLSEYLANREWETVPYRKGELIHPGLQYLGFVRVLRGLRKSFDLRPHLHVSCCPLVVGEMFDKNRTLERLTEAGIACPDRLPVPGTVDEVLEQLFVEGFSPGYVKLATGSSASGIAVVHTQVPRSYAITSLVEIDGDFYNTRLLQRVTAGALRRSLAFILEEGATIQRGIPMAQIDGLNFDVRVVMVYGEPRFTIFRLSPHPMTNLHLGGQRGDLKRCHEVIPKRAWLDALDSCVEVARLYPSNTIAGIDLVFERSFRAHYVLEVNAFGDFFPNLLDEQGKSVHRVEIEETARRWGAGEFVNYTPKS